MKNSKYRLTARVQSRNNKLLSSLLSTLLSASIVMSLFSSSILASVDVSTGGAPAQPAATGSYSVSAADSTSYVEPVNTFHDGSPTYYLVTQDPDPLKALWTSVTYDGVDYPLSPETIKVLPAVNGKADISSIIDIFVEGATIFFDTGTYNDSAPSEYTRFSKLNLSMVGLYTDVNEEPTAKITKSVRTDGMIERNIVMDKNVYYENLIFDGQGKNLVTKSRGETAFAISGGTDLDHSASAGFVMKDCIIQNYGAKEALGTNKNVAIMFFQTAGQHNIDNLKIRLIRTQGIYGIVSFNQATGNYFKDLSIDGSIASAGATAIKIESASPNIFAANLIVNSFAGSLTLTSTLPTSGSFSRIYIQDYGYSTVLPDAMRYVQYSTSNGYTRTGIFNIIFSKEAGYVSSVLPSVTSEIAVWDRSDNYWIVRSGASQTVFAQLGYINSVLVNAAAVGGVVPTANIKLIASTGGLLDTFDVPDFGDIDVNIVAVAAESDPYSITDMIFLAAGATITLPAANYGKIKLYNIDFHQNAKYTLQEAVSGINPASVTLTDPNETSLITGYPVYSNYGPAVSAAKVTRSSFDTFVNCRFTSLAKEIEVTNVINKIGVGSNAAFAARLTDSDTNSYTGSGITSGLKNTADDTEINWFSSDPLIVSIDKLTGEATALAPGTVTITAKAVDKYNNGEIEKPYDTFSLQAALPYTVTYSDNGSSGGSLTSASNNYLDGDTTLVLDKDTLFKDEYKFIGWNTKQDGSGILYQPGDVLAISGNIELFAQWELLPPTSTPTPDPTASPTPSVTPDPTASPTPSVTPDPTASPTPSVTPNPTASPTPSVTPDPTASPTPSVTPDPTASPTPSVTPDPTASPTPSVTPNPTASPTPSVTPEPSDTPAAPPTSTPAPTAAPTPTPTAAPTPAPTAAPTPAPTTAPTPATGVLGTDRGLTDTPSPASALTVAAAPTTTPASHVLSAVTKTGEKADPVFVFGMLSIVLSGCVLSWIVMRNRKKD